MSGDYVERLRALMKREPDILTHDEEADLCAALDELEQLRTERAGGMAWDEWFVRILIGDGAVTREYDDETEARIRYREFVDHHAKAWRIVQDSTSYPSPIRSIELLCRTNWDGDYRVVESTPQQPAPEGSD